MTILISILTFVVGLLTGGLAVLWMYASGFLDDRVEAIAGRRGLDDGEREPDESSRPSPPDVSGAPSSAQGELQREEAPDRDQRPADTEGTSEVAEGDASESESGADRSTASDDRGPDIQHWFEGMNASIEGKTYRLGDQPLMVGRHPDADIQVKKGEVSRRHCLLKEISPAEGGKPVVEPLEAENETRVNGDVVDNNRILYDDDVIEVGPVLIAYRKNARFDRDYSQDSSDVGVAMQARTAAVQLESWRERIERALHEYNGDIRKTADALEMDDQELRQLIAQFDIGPN